MVTVTWILIVLRPGSTIVTLLVINALGAASLPVISKFYRHRVDAVIFFHVLLSLSKEDMHEA